MFDLPKILEPPQEPDRIALNEHYKLLFPSYDWRPHDDYVSLAKEYCWLFDDIINKREKRWLSALGKSGTGKTAWANKLRNELKNRDFEVQRWDWSTVCDEYLGKGDYGIMLHLKMMPILIIDEIGKNDWKVGNQKLSHLLDQRMNKWTICISNMSQSDIASKVDVRIASRMGRDPNRMSVMSLECPDYSNAKRVGKI